MKLINIYWTPFFFAPESLNLTFNSMAQKLAKMQNLSNLVYRSQQGRYLPHGARFYADGKLQLIRKNIFPAVSIISYGYLYYQLSVNKLFLSFSSYRLSEINNEDPPTTVYFVATVGLLSL